MNFNTMILDHFDEMSAGTKTAQALCKEAGIINITSKSDSTRLDGDDFALVIFKGGEQYRKFPIDTRSNTLLSKEAFLRNKTKLTMEAVDIAEGRLKEACSRFNINNSGLNPKTGSLRIPYYFHTDLAEINHGKMMKSAEMTKEAGMKKFAIDASRHGHPIQKYPINTVDEVKTAAEDVSVKLPAQWFIKAAHGILNRARELNVTIDPVQDIHIVENTKLSSMFPLEINKRIKLAGGEGAMKYMNLEKIASEGDLAGVAIAMEEIDVLHGLRSKWGSGLMPPAIAVFGLPKQATFMEMEHGSISPESLSSFVADNKEEIQAAIGEAAISLTEALSDIEVAPTVLASILLNEMGKTWMIWEPSVVWESLEERTGIALDRAQQDKIMAMRTAIKTDQALTQYPVFLNVARAFNGLSIAPETINLVSPEMIAWTLSELKDIGGDPLEEDDVELNDTVSSIICAILFEHGLIYVPEDPIGEMIKGDLLKYQARYNAESIAFALDAENAYKHVSSGDGQFPEPGSPLAIHTSKLLLIDAYVSQKREEKEAALVR
jgi:hypothetical protein